MSSGRKRYRASPDRGSEQDLPSPGGWVGPRSRLVGVFTNSEPLDSTVKWFLRSLRYVDTTDENTDRCDQFSPQPLCPPRRSGVGLKLQPSNHALTFW